MIGSLGRQPTEDKLTIYIKQDNEPQTKEMLPTLIEQSPISSRRRSDQGPSSTDGLGTATRLLNRYRQQTPLDVPNDLLRTIEEVDRTKSPVETAETYDRSPAPLPAGTVQPSPLLSAAEREKKRYQRTMVNQ